MLSPAVASPLLSFSPSLLASQPVCLAVYVASAQERQRLLLQQQQSMHEQQRQPAGTNRTPFQPSTPASIGAALDDDGEAVPLHGIDAFLQRVGVGCLLYTSDAADE